MSEKFIKYRNRLLFPATVILSIIAFINLYFIFEVTPRSNDECLWVPKQISPDSTIFVFDLVKEGGVTWQAGIRDGDQLLEINGQKINSLFTASKAIDQLAKGDSATYKIIHNGKIIETKVKIKKLINFAGFSFVLLALFWLLVGYVVISSKPNGRAQRLFYSIGVLFVINSMWVLIASTPSINPIWNIRWLLVLIDFITSTAALILPFVYVYFFWVFPKPFKFVEKKITKSFLFGLPLLLIVGMIIFKLLYVYTSQSSYKLNMYLIFFFNSLFGLSFIIGFISLFISYVRLNNAKEKNPIFIILVSYAIALLSIIYVNTLANVLAGSIFNSPEYFMPIILIVVLPVAFGYSIFKYSLLDVSDVIKNTLMYGVATVSIAGIYFLVMYILGQKISQAIATEYQGLIAAIIFIVFSIVFQSTKDRFQEIITRRFYPEQFAYRKVLLEFSNNISTIVGLDNILDSVLNTFVDSLKLEKFGIVVKDNNSGECSLVRSFGFEKNKLKFNCNIKKVLNYLNRKTESGQYPVFERTEFNEVFPEVSDRLTKEGIYIVIPLMNKTSINGMLLFGLKHSGAQFAGKDLELLVAAANQTAISIENARLYEAETEKIKLERDLIVAKKIQQQLLPQEIPTVHGLDIAGFMQPAMHVGGDYYDLIKVSPTKIFVVIADVSGKGLSASFYMSKLQTMIRLYCTENKTPKDILIELNRHMFENLDKQWFITATIAFFDTSNKIVKLSRAGHTPIKLLRDGEVKSFTPKGLGLGLERGDVFESTLTEIEIHLAPNDLFLFTTDGIEEAMNENRQLFGEKRLERILKENSSLDAKRILQKITENVNRFQNGNVANDDLTLVVIKVTKLINEIYKSRTDDFINPSSRLA